MQVSFLKKLFLFQILVIAALVLAIFSFRGRNLKIVACDVGQGDAILISFGKTQILTDGGPDDSVLACLGKEMPFWDRTIELVILTHPDKDHFGGLIDVFERYRVERFFTIEAEIGKEDYQVLKNVVGGSGTLVSYPTDTLDVRLGKIYLDILSPTEEMLREKGEDLNDLSIVYHLAYNSFDALFTGDIGFKAINNLLSKRMIKDVEYIKVPHHGSGNNISSSLLEFSKPEVAVISVGKNSYGHPNREVLDLLAAYGSEVYRTDQMGDVVFYSNGEDFRLRKRLKLF